MTKKIIGIDLGTTNSCVAFMDGQQAQIISNSEGTRTTPSAVFIDPSNGQITVGASALRQHALQPGSTVVAVKRLIGKKYDDEALKNIKFLNIVPADNNDAWVNINGKKTSPQEVSAHIIKKMKETAEEFLGTTVSQAVITVPAYFNDAQRQATKDAGRIAGLEVKRIINEPTAAALAYGFNKKSDQDKKIAIYDLGGGTFDVSIIEITNIEGEVQVEVLSTNGDTYLGGEDFDQVITDYILAEFRKEQGLDLSKDPVAFNRVKEAAEKAKKELSNTLYSQINLPFIGVDPQGGVKHLNMNLTIEKFNQLIAPLVERTLVPCQKALDDAGLTRNGVDSVLLVGGQTRTSFVREKVEEFFGQKPRTDINPDEAVAQGAAIQAGVLAGDVKDVLLLDVTPLSLGIETANNVMVNLIDRNSSIPTKTSKSFTTAEDNQNAVTIRIMQGERKIASQNKCLGNFDLTGIPPAPRGIPQIEVSFDIDANGILHVSALDKASGNQQSISVQSSGGLKEEEIQDIIRKAEQNKEVDRQFEELMQSKISAERLIASARKHLKDNKIEDRKDILQACDDLESTIKGDNKDDIQNKTKVLQDLIHPVIEQFYKEQQQKSQQNQQQTADQENSKEDVKEEVVVENNN